MKIHVATLSTQIIEFRDPGEPTEGGVFEIVVEIDTLEMRKSNSPKQYLFRQIASALHHGIKETTVPKDYWNISFTEWTQREFNLPPASSFKDS